jgi:hypothetical protein
MRKRERERGDETNIIQKRKENANTHTRTRFDTEKFDEKIYFQEKSI